MRPGKRWDGSGTGCRLMRLEDAVWFANARQSIASRAHSKSQSNEQRTLVHGPPPTRDGGLALLAAAGGSLSLGLPPVEGVPARISGTWLFGLNAALAYFELAINTPRHDLSTANLGFDDPRKARRSVARITALNWSSRPSGRHG